MRELFKLIVCKETVWLQRRYSRRLKQSHSFFELDLLQQTVFLFQKALQSPALPEHSTHMWLDRLELPVGIDLNGNNKESWRYDTESSPMQKDQEGILDFFLSILTVAYCAIEAALNKICKKGSE